MRTWITKIHLKTLDHNGVNVVSSHVCNFFSFKKILDYTVIRVSEIKTTVEYYFPFTESAFQKQIMNIDNIEKD